MNSLFLALAGKYKVAKPIKAEKIRNYIKYGGEGNDEDFTKLKILQTATPKEII